MKKRIAFALAVACAVLGLTGCDRQEELQQGDNNGLKAVSIYRADEIEAVEPDAAIPDFSYAEESAIYAEGDPGVKTSGFANTSETEITFENAAECAGKECTIEYDSTAIYRDSTAGVWKVHFYTVGMSGGDQTVYLDHNGKTLLIVYGE